MLLLGHVVIGSSIGVIVDHPGQAFLLGVISHFITDALPHWNYILRSPITLKKAIAYCPDVLAPGIVFCLFLAAFPERSGAIALAALGGVLPDLIALSNLLSRSLRDSRPMGIFHKLHSTWHWEIGIVPGMAVQALAIAATLLAVRAWYLG